MDCVGCCSGSRIVGGYWYSLLGLGSTRSSSILAEDCHVDCDHVLRMFRSSDLHHAGDYLPWHNGKVMSAVTKRLLYVGGVVLLIEFLLLSTASFVAWCLLHYNRI